MSFNWIMMSLSLKSQLHHSHEQVSLSFSNSSLHPWLVRHFHNFLWDKSDFMWNGSVISSPLLEKGTALRTAGGIISEFKWQYISLALKYLLSWACYGCLNIYTQLLVCASPFPTAFCGMEEKEQHFFKNLSPFWRWEVCLCHRCRTVWIQNETF